MNTKLLAIFYLSLIPHRMIHNVISFIGKAGAYKLPLDKTIALKEALAQANLQNICVKESHMGQGIPLNIYPDDPNTDVPRITL